ncbi:MAG: disulfide bond formation protein DsbB [Pasteurellaceae bacterium]|nr:disulfide bond formation protein DsbB [Pasteurellaceae bacterium]
MFAKLKTLSTQRIGWFLLLISALAFEACALYFQYGMDLRPCVMCIYERVAIFVIAFSGLIGCLLPQYLLWRLFALAIGLAGAIKGLMLAIKHVNYQLHPSPLNQCTYLPEFPDTLPLDKWLPSLFQPTGVCTDKSWEFLGFSMAQWIVLILSIYVVVLVAVLISQFFRIRTQKRLFS